MASNIHVMGLYADARKPGRAEAARRLVDAVSNRTLQILVGADLAESGALGAVHAASWEELFDADLIVAIGGDGTLLRVAREALGKRHTPVMMGVNAGRLGFLSATPLDQAGAFLHKVLDGCFLLQERMMLVVERWKGLELLQRGVVLNDAVISSNAEIPRLLHLTVHVGEIHVTTVSADGIVFATPTGSTAHSLSAGGPILDPGMQAMIMTPICPHALGVRPLVMDSNLRLQVEAASPGQSIRTVLDGQVAWSLGTDECLRITRCSEGFPLVLPEDWDFFSAMRRKLDWKGSLMPFAR